MRLIILSLITLTLLGAEDTLPQTPLPLAAQRAIATYDIAIKEIESKALKAKLEATKALDTRLMAEIKSATQKGDLAVALALQEKWTATCGQVPDYNLRGEKPADRPTVLKVTAYLIGTWTVNKSAGASITVSFAKDGTATASNGATGKWVLGEDAKTCLITWMNGHTYSILFAGEEQARDTFPGKTSYTPEGEITWIKGKVR